MGVGCGSDAQSRVLGLARWMQGTRFWSASMRHIDVAAMSLRDAQDSNASMVNSC